MCNITESEKTISLIEKIYKIKKMRFTDLSDQHIKIKNSLYKGIKKLFNHHKYILGPEIYELEKLSKYTGSKYVVSCSSGTDAILMSLMALDVKKGDEIITSPFTWMSNVEMIKLLGAKPFMQTYV